MELNCRKGFAPEGLNSPLTLTPLHLLPDGGFLRVNKVKICMPNTQANVATHIYYRYRRFAVWKMLMRWEKKQHMKYLWFHWFGHLIKMNVGLPSAEWTFVQQRSPAAASYCLPKLGRHALWAHSVEAARIDLVTGQLQLQRGPTVVWCQCHRLVGWTFFFFFYERNEMIELLHCCSRLAVRSCRFCAEWDGGWQTFNIFPSGILLHLLCVPVCFHYCRPRCFQCSRQLWKCM